jgi:hypothetical protein
MKMPCRLQLEVVIALLCSGLAGSAMAASVSSISPSSGPTTGGQVVRIFTSGIAINATPGSNTVLFGATAATVTAVNVANNTLDVASTPAGAAGAVTITVNGTVSAAPLYTYVSRNPQLIVVVSVTVAKRAQIQWGAGTTNDDAGVNHTLAANAISNYAWTVKDNTLLAASQTDLATIYRSDDAQNNKVINISNVSATGNACTVSAIATKIAGNFNLAAAAGANVSAIKGSMNGGGLASLFAAVNLTVNLTTAADMPLVLEFDNPTTVAAGNAGVLNQYNVTLTATAN